MSIASDRQERTEAAARLESITDEVLERDLVHWTLASYESAGHYHDVNEQLQALRDLHAEEEWWIRLHAEELRRRRARRREESRS